MFLASLFLKFTFVLKIKFVYSFLTIFVNKMNKEKIIKMKIVKSQKRTNELTG